MLLRDAAAETAGAVEIEGSYKLIEFDVWDHRGGAGVRPRSSKEMECRTSPLVPCWVSLEDATSAGIDSEALVTDKLRVLTEHERQVVDEEMAARGAGTELDYPDADKSESDESKFEGMGKKKHEIRVH